ncbi:MAG: pyridoxine 5'-phosphate synthase [Deltaproteobacteria bacterium]|nr:pyridoxine 5'-phosphate synthase [Deltaproteobacteria bacterium]
MARLGVNVDHVATVRQARRTVEPDPVAAAALAELAGADAIVCHLREDRRHIQERDLTLLRQTVKTHLNLEMAATEEMLRIARQVHPDRATLVPERREEVTTEGGLEVALNPDAVGKAVQRLKEEGILVSLFIDAEPDQIRAAREVGGDLVELHTGPYAHAFGTPAELREFDRLMAGVRLGLELGLRVAAGHGLDYHNIKRLARVAEIEEFNIGHSIVARAIFVGIHQAVREMVELLRGGG